MKSKNETFSQLMENFGRRYELRSVFDDFLTLTLCSFSQNAATDKSYDEELYLQTISKYAKDDLRHQFPKLLAVLVLEMEERLSDSLGNDVLGDYFEQNFCRKNSGQFFTPWPVCEFMAKIICADSIDAPPDKRLRIIDPTCGSGRMLLAGANNFGREHEYYGIDIDHTCVKMTVLNLFLNGVFHGEVMWANALSPDDFRMSYVLSFLPFGIFRIENKEKSRLWHLNRNSFEKMSPTPKSPDIILPSKGGSIDFGKDVTQISLF